MANSTAVANLVVVTILLVFVIFMIITRGRRKVNPTPPIKETIIVPSSDYPQIWDGGRYPIRRWRAGPWGGRRWRHWRP